MSIAYQLKRSNKRKTLSIKISDGQVIVYSPLKLSKTLIDRCVLQKQDWILSNLDKQKENRATTILLHRSVDILQHTYHLQFITNQRESKVIANENALTIMTSLRVKKTQDKQLSLVSQYCSTKLSEYCKEKAREYAKRIGKKPNNISVKLFKRRWGTCDNKGNLQFNTQLVTAPLWVIDYVVAHEVAHLVELNHSYKFWRIVKQLYQDINKAEKWLKVNGIKLDIFKKD
jgi:predicted metal-dependent hydrolase